MEDSAILRMLSMRAVKEFEEMKAKCTEYHDKFIYNQKRVQKLEFQFKQLKRASLLAVSEYENLHKSYTAEVASRQDIENRLSKIDAENKQLRKANDYAPNTMIMKEQSDGSAGKGELEGLRGLVIGMKDELRRTKDEITNLKSDLNSEKVSHEATQHKYRISQEHVKQLNSVSIMALEEYQELKKKHEIELDCRAKAEEYATEMVREKAIVDRKSKWFAEHSDDDDRLKIALDNVDQITREAAEEQHNLKLKIAELEEELGSSKEEQTIKDAEKKIKIAFDQCDLLQTQLEYSEKRSQDLEIDNASMRSRLEAALAGVFIPAPPPPPPTPPPPPLPGLAIRGFISKLGKKKKVTGLPPKDDPRTDAMADMIARIKSGNVKLKSTRTEADTKQDSAMGELANMLSGLRQGRVGSQDSLDVVDKDEPKVPEFQKFKLKKVVRKENSVPDSDDAKPEVGELKKILDRKRNAVAAATESRSGKGPPAVAPKSDKIASLSQGSITSEMSQASTSTNDKMTDNINVSSSPPNISSVVIQPSIQKATNASVIDSTPQQQSTPIDIPSKSGHISPSTPSVSVSPPKSSNSTPPQQLNISTANVEDTTDALPTRPPRRRSSARVDPRNTEQTTADIQLEDNQEPVPAADSVLIANSVKDQTKSSETITTADNDPKPELNAAETIPEVHKKTNLTPDSDLAAALSEMDQLMSEFE